METKSVVEDYKSNALGGLIAGLEIWEIAIMPFLLNNSETWVEISRACFKTLDDIQIMFLRHLMGTPRTCPTPILLWDTGSILMKHRVASRKLMFYHHLINLPEDSLAFEITKV